MFHDKCTKKGSDAVILHLKLSSKIIETQGKKNDWEGARGLPRDLPGASRGPVETTLSKKYDFGAFLEPSCGLLGP